MQSDLWSSEFALETDKIEILGESTRVINRFALLSQQSPVDFKYNQSLIVLLHWPLTELYLDKNRCSFSIYRNQTFQSYLARVNHESLVENRTRSKVVRILF